MATFVVVLTNILLLNDSLVRGGCLPNQGQPWDSPVRQVFATQVSDCLLSKTLVSLYDMHTLSVGTNSWCDFPTYHRGSGTAWYRQGQWHSMNNISEWNCLPFVSILVLCYFIAILVCIGNIRRLLFSVVSVRSRDNHPLPLPAVGGWEGKRLRYLSTYSTYVYIAYIIVFLLHVHCMR